MDLCIVITRHRIEDQVPNLVPGCNALLEPSARPWYLMTNCILLGKSAGAIKYEESTTLPLKKMLVSLPIRAEIKKVKTIQKDNLTLTCSSILTKMKYVGVLVCASKQQNIRPR